MKKVMQYLFGFLAFVVLLLGVLFLVYNEKLPEGKPGAKADALAHKMVKAVNLNAYKNTKYLEWTFNKGKHRYVWDKENGRVKVQWDQNTVQLNLNDTSKSKVQTKEGTVSEEAAKKLITTAWNYFNNDSFWLVAPFKVFDKGATRSIVTLPDGNESLLITYNSGGTTPGDSYLWKLQANGFPESYKMWVKIIPIGGIEASWEDWKIMDSGAFLPTTHKLGPLTLDMGEVKAYN